MNKKIKKYKIQCYIDKFACKIKIIYKKAYTWNIDKKKKKKNGG